MEEYRNEAVEKVITWIASTVGLFSLAALFIAQHWVFWLFAILVLFCVLTLMFDFTIRRVTRLTYRDVGQFSTVGQDFRGKQKTFKPLGIASISERTTKVIPIIPTVSEMLAKNLLDGVIMHHGYQITEDKELVPLTGSFEDNRTFAIIGKGGVGKTVRLFFLLIQCILAHSTIYLCDPHGGLIGSITKLLEPLSPCIKIAVTNPKGDVEAQIMAMVAEFTDRMERRVHDQEDDRSPCVLVIDEFTRMMYHEQYGEPCVEAVVGCANQYRKVEGYSIVLMHELVATKNRNVTNLVARLRRSLHAVFVMRTDKEYAKYFLSGKHVNQAAQLKKGTGFFVNTDGEVHLVHTPKGTVSDAFTVAKMIVRAIDAPMEPLQLTRVSPMTQNLISQPKEQIAFRYPDPNPNLSNSMQVLSLPSPEPTNEPGGFDSYQARREEVRRLKTLNLLQSEIIQRVWHVKKGASSRYDAALAEYKSIIQDL